MLIKRLTTCLKWLTYRLFRIAVKTMLVLFPFYVIMFLLDPISVHYKVYRFENQYVTILDRMGYRYVMPYKYDGLLLPDKNFILVTSMGGFSIYEEEGTLFIYDLGSWLNESGVEGVCLPDYPYEFFPCSDDKRKETAKGLSFKHSVYGENMFAYGESPLATRPDSMNGMKKTLISLTMLLFLVLCWGNEKMGMDGNHAPSKLFSMGEVIKRTIVRLRKGLYILSHIMIKTMMILFLPVFLFFMWTFLGSYTVYRFEDRYVTFWQKYVMPYRYKKGLSLPEKNFILLNRGGSIMVYDEDTPLLIYDMGGYPSDTLGVKAICLPDYPYEYFAHPDSASRERIRELSLKYLSIREFGKPYVFWIK